MTDELGSELCDILPLTIYSQAMPRILESDYPTVCRMNPLARPLGTLRMNATVPGAVDNEQWTDYLWQHSPYSQNKLEEFACRAYGLAIIAPDPRFRQGIGQIALAALGSCVDQVLGERRDID